MQGPRPASSAGACQRSHRDLQLPCGHLRQPLEDAVCNAALQAVEGRHVAAYRRHMAALILLQMHQIIVVHLPCADSVIDRRDHDAVDGIGDAGRRQIGEDGLHMQHGHTQKAHHRRQQENAPDGRPSSGGQAHIAQSLHGTHLPCSSVCREGRRGAYSRQPLTMALKVLPRSMKFLNWSKAAQAGDSVTTSLGCARSRAASTARWKGVTSRISGWSGR